MDGPIARVRDQPPEQLNYTGAAQGLVTLWLVATTSLSNLLDSVSLQDLLIGRWPRAAGEAAGLSDRTETAPHRWRG